MTTARTALIIGASRGLGLGLVQTLLADGWQVTATVRNPQKAEALQALGDVRIEQLDMDDQQAQIALSEQLKGQVFDLLFVNAGVKGRKCRHPTAVRRWPKSVSCFLPMPWRRSTSPSVLSGRFAQTAACWRS